MSSSANDRPENEEKILLSELVRPRFPALYAPLLIAVAVAAYSVFWMVPVPRVIFRVILTSCGAVMLLMMILAALRRTAVSFLYELSEDTLLISRIFIRHKKVFAAVRLSEIEKMERFAAGLPKGRRKNACVTRLPACEKGISVVTRDSVYLIEPSESFARTLSRLAAGK